MRSNRTMRRGKIWTTAGQPRGRIIDAVSSWERPAEVEDLGQRHAFATSNEQCHFQCVFEQINTPPDCGLSNLQRAGRSGQAACLRNGQKGSDMVP